MNEKHYVKVEIPELQYENYLHLLWRFAENRCDLSRKDESEFKELFKIFEETYNNIK